MLTNTERQAIVEEVNAGTYGIDEALDDIAAAQKGEEVRKALYAEALVLNREGHAGSTDMIARQRIANLQTTVNGQISTLRTEVGEDIADLEAALNSGLATQNGKIAAQDATIANVVANYNVEYGSTELWASTGETGALAAGTTVTLSEDVSHFDYIDIYSFLGNNNILDTLPVDAKLQSNDGYALRWVNLSDPGSGTYEAYVRIIETKIKIIGTTLTIVHQVTYSNGASVSISGAEITQSNRSTYVGELGIMKVVGRKITANTEVEDIRTGADGTEYESAGQAVRAQVNDLYDAIPAIDDGLDTAGKAADAKAVGDELTGLNERLDQLDGGGMTEEAKQALLTLVSHIGLWDDDHGQDYIDALEAALYPPASLTRITAVYTQTGDVYTDTSLDSLKSDLVVTAHYSDSTSETISAYTLSGTLTEGTSTVTVSYGGKTATFSVTVTGRLLPSGYQQLEYIYSEGNAYFESAVSPRTYPIRIEMGIYKESQASSEQAVIAKKIGTSSSLEVGYNATSNTLFAYSAASAKVTNAVVYGNELDVVAEFNSTSPYKTLSVTANGETVSAQNTDANNTNILNTNNLLFFVGGASNLKYIGRMYYCRVYSNEELIGNFIPCYDKETGYAGMYETVGGTFHYSQGSRGFKRGGEV